MKLATAFDKLGLSWHDVFITTALLETSWWLMYTFMDGADVFLRLNADEHEYHPFLVVQKIVSCSKLVLSLTCIWYGTIIRGRVLPLQIYLLLGVLVDTTLIITWMIISIEEHWPLAPANTFGVHYIITFVFYRGAVYWVTYRFMREIFVTPFGPPAVGTVNGTVVGIPEQGRSVDSGSNLVFFGKGFGTVLEYYRVECERASMITLVWDVVWNSSIIISQELPELLCDMFFIGIFGSLPLYVPTENLSFRLIRTILGVVGIYLLIRKIPRHLKIWICCYWVLFIANTIFFCYETSTDVTEEDTASAIFILCSVFFASNGARIIVGFCAMRFYVHLKSANVPLVNENE